MDKSSEQSRTKSIASVYGLDSLGNDVVRGYGAIHIPLTSTVHVPYVTLKIPVFVPESASIMQRIAGWIMGRRPEFVDPRVVTSGNQLNKYIPKTYQVLHTFLIKKQPLRLT